MNVGDLLTNGNCGLDTETKAWLDRVAEHIKETVCNDPIIRVYAYRHDANYFAVDFFEKQELSGKSLAMTICVEPSNRAYKPSLEEPRDDSMEITVLDAVDVWGIIHGLALKLKKDCIMLGAS
jgi:hypothetical protein